MHLKSITSFIVMVLLVGVSTSALQNSVFAQTSSTSDLDNDITKRLDKIPKDKLKQETKDNLKQETKDKLKQETGQYLRPETSRPICNPEDSDNARKELSTIEQRYGKIKTKYYEEWQRLHESGEYDRPWETFAQEHFLNSPELSEMKKIREKYSEVFRNCNDAKETRPYPVSSNDVREVKPYQVSPTNTRIDCNQDNYLHVKKELVTLEQRHGSLKEKYYQEWQKMHQSGEYDGSWDNFAKEHFMNSPDMAGAQQIHEKYSELLRHCNQVTDARSNPTGLTIPSTVCKEDYGYATKELATLENRYGELKTKFYNEWQRLHESGDYDGPWEKFAEEKFLNSPEIANLNQMREKYHQLMMRCSNAQQEVTGEDNYEEETTSDDDLTDEFEDDIVLDDATTDDLNEETTLNDDLDKLLTEIESISIPESINVPESIKDDASWWADNQIEDSEFASSIEYLASQNVMELAPSGPDSSSHIPAWVKAIAAWWAEGKIPDNEFVNAVRFLVDHGIIKV